MSTKYEESTLSIDKSAKVNGIGIKSVRGVNTTIGIANMTFLIHGEDGYDEDIILNNITYLPECPRNFISIN